MEIGFIFIIVMFTIANYVLSKLADIQLISWKSRNKYVRSSSCIILLIVFILLKLSSELTSPYTTFSFVNYRVDLLKEYNITIKGHDDVKIIFKYQVLSKTLLGDKIIDVTADQFSRLKVGDVINNRGNKINQTPSIEVNNVDMEVIEIDSK